MGKIDTILDKIYRILDKILGISPCPHENWAWERNIYGDEIFIARGRSCWVCTNCGKREFRPFVDRPEVICHCGAVRPKWRACYSCGSTEEIARR